MKNPNYFNLLLIFAVCITSVLKGQEIPISIIDRLNSVNYIFEGTVINSEPYYADNGTYIYTSNTIEISRILKGNIECGTIELITKGGQINNERLDVSHALQVIEGSTGIFMCNETDAPLSIVDYYPETNIEKLEATFENQSFIRYWWDGQGINAADLWLNYDSLSALYNSTEAITGLHYFECTANPNSLLSIESFNSSNSTEEKEENFPVYSKTAFNELIKYAEYKRKNLSKPSNSRSPDKIFYSLENLIISGSTQKYLEFDVTVKDNLGTKYLDQSAVRLEYDPAIFGTNIVANTNILVSSGTLNSDTSCYSAPVPSDQNSNTILIPALEKIGSLCKAPILTTPQSIMHIKMKIQNCNIPANITLQDTATIFGPSLILNYSAYADSPTDSFQTYYTEIEHNQIESVPACKATITSFEPTSLVGGISDTLTIRGFQFGDSKGTGNVYFKNANDGGTSETYLDHLDTILWSDTLIKVHVPSYDSSIINGTAQIGQPAGSGFFRVIADDGTSDISPTPITIRYSLFNNETKDNIFIAPSNQFNGKFTFHCEHSVANYKNGAMKDVIRKALADWTCLTGIDWVLGNDTTYLDPNVKQDSICIIKFSNLAPNDIAIGSQMISGFVNGSNIFSVAKELDIEINQSYNYFCDTTGAIVPSNEKDIYAVILHELGHTHGLNHVIDPNAIMDYAYNPNIRKTNLEFDYSCDEGGNWIIKRSVLLPNATLSAVGASRINANPNPPCTHVSIIEYKKDQIDINTYPNPFNDVLNISLKTNFSNSINIRIFDLSGKLIFSQTQSVVQGLNMLTLPTTMISKGMYILNISSSENLFMVNSKIIKE